MVYMMMMMMMVCIVVVVVVLMLQARVAGECLVRTDGIWEGWQADRVLAVLMEAVMSQWRVQSWISLHLEEKWVAVDTRRGRLQHRCHQPKSDSMWKISSRKAVPADTAIILTHGCV
jgi:hypothetical protein